jgi:predicted phosphohydrolase
MFSTMTLDKTKIPRLILVGDVHGEIGRYVDLVSGYAYSLQVGDMGFRYTGLEKLDPENHKFVGGNHDFYPDLIAGKVPHYLGNFGTWKNKLFPYGGLFFVRGGYSIDKEMRIQGRDWFPEEELSIAEGYEAISLYEKEKPNFVVSHECPVSIISMVGLGHHYGIKPSRTAQLLESMLHIHKPKIWIFGHHHVHLDITINHTRFMCLPILGAYTFPLNGVKEE